MDSTSYPVTATVVPVRLACFHIRNSKSNSSVYDLLSQKNEEKKLSSLFWKKFRENISLYGKQDSLASSYFLLLFIDYRIFHYLGGGIGYTLMYTTLFLLLLSAVLFSYKILLQLENQKEVSWIAAFFLFFNDFKSALFYLAGTSILLVALWFAGPIYLALLGFSFLFYFQVLLFIHRTQEKGLKRRNNMLRLIAKIDDSIINKFAKQRETDNRKINFLKFISNISNGGFIWLLLATVLVLVPDTREYGLAILIGSLIYFLLVYFSLKKRQGGNDPMKKSSACPLHK